MMKYFLGSDNRQRPANTVTTAELQELQSAARFLRSELDAVVEDEVACHEACEAASDNILRLRALSANRRDERDGLKMRAVGAQAEYHAAQESCSCEERRITALHKDLSGLRDGIKVDAARVVEARDQTRRIKFTLDTAVPETIFRLRAEVQNSLTECEIEKIQVKNLSDINTDLQNYVKKARQQQTEIEYRVAQLNKELEEAKTQHDLSQTRYQFLSHQLQCVNPNNNMMSSVQNLFAKMTAREVSSSSPKQDQSTAVQSNDTHNTTSKYEKQINNLQCAANELFKPPEMWIIRETQSENKLCKAGQHENTSILCKNIDDDMSALTLDQDA